MFTEAVLIPQELLILHSNVFNPLAKLDTVVFGLEAFAKTPKPAVTNHCPAPEVGVFATQFVVVVLHNV
jgi:hypothetical protein